MSITIHRRLPRNFANFCTRWDNHFKRAKARSHWINYGKRNLCRDWKNHNTKGFCVLHTQSYPILCLSQFIGGLQEIQVIAYVDYKTTKDAITLDDRWKIHLMPQHNYPRMARKAKLLVFKNPGIFKTSILILFILYSHFLFIVIHVIIWLRPLLRGHC